MKCISVNIVMFVILLSIQSCIKDDRSDCKDSALRLAFRYTLNNQHTDLFETEVTKVTVYVFDASNKYVGTYTESGDNLKNKNFMTISLPEGRYQAIVFCDNLNTFTTDGLDSGASLSDFRIVLNSMEDADGYLIPQSVPGDLFAGYASDILATYNESCITTVDLMKDTKNIKIKITGLNYLARSVIVPNVYVTAINGKYKGDNSIDTSHRMLKYIPHYTSVTDNRLEADLRTMRLLIGHSPMLVIKDPAIPGYLFNQNITQLILVNPKYTSQEDIDREDTFVFEINLNQTDNNVVISILINGWKINTITPATD